MGGEGKKGQPPHEKKKQGEGLQENRKLSSPTLSSCPPFTPPSASMHSKKIKHEKTFFEERDREVMK